MKGFALMSGGKKPKVIDIGLNEQALWWAAWGLAERSLVHAPIKIGRPQKEELRAAGFDVKPIVFHRVIEDRK